MQPSTAPQLYWSRYAANETPYLRQVSDGARMAANIGCSAIAMGDFWHIALVETSCLGAFIWAGQLLLHVHIAGLKERIIPSVYPKANQYGDGFKD